MAICSFKRHFLKCKRQKHVCLGWLELNLFWTNGQVLCKLYFNFLWHNVIKDSVFAISLPLGLSVLQDFVKL